MDVVLLLVRLTLAAVFLVAGGAKLADLPGSVAAVRGFGVPDRLARPLGAVLPVIEIATALLLLPNATAAVGALVASGLLAAFLVGMGAAIQRGQAPDCHCFGQLHSEPVGPRSAARNAVLLLLALLVAVRGLSDPGISPFALLAGLSVVEAVLFLGLVVVLVAVAAEGWLIAQLLRQNGRLLLRMDQIEAGRLAPNGDDAGGSRVGTPVPEAPLTTLDGEAVQLRDLLGETRQTLLIFSDPACGPCAALRPEIAAWQREHGGRLTVVMITRGDPAVNRAHAREHDLDHVYLEAERSASRALGITGTPAGLLVSRDGTVASEVAPGATAIRALVQTALARPQIPLNGAPRPPAATVGDAAPTFSLPDLDGRTRTFPDGRQRETVLLFWNPGCGFCQRLTPEIASWAESRSDSAPELIIITSGGAAENRNLATHALVLLDSGFATGRRYVATGTPSAILVDAGGRIASPVAVGGQAVMALLRGPVHSSAPSASAPAKALEGP